MGFYESVEETTPIIRVRLGEEWFVEPTGRIEICNVNPPVRAVD